MLDNLGQDKYLAVLKMLNDSIACLQSKGLFHSDVVRGAIEQLLVRRVLLGVF